MHTLKQNAEANRLLTFILSPSVYHVSLSPSITPLTIVEGLRNRSRTFRIYSQAGLLYKCWW